MFDREAEHGATIRERDLWMKEAESHYAGKVYWMWISAFLLVAAIAGWAR